MKKDYVTGAKRSSSKIKGNSSHFKMWKSGKSWLYASSAILMLSGIIAPSVQAVTTSADTATAVPSRSVSSVSPASSVVEPVTSALSSSQATVASEAKAVTPLSSTTAQATVSATTQSAPSAKTVITGTWGTAPVSFDTATGMMTVSAGNLNGTLLSYCWKTGIDISTIKTINLFVGVICPPDSSDLFANAQNLTGIYGLGTINTSAATNMYRMFFDCSSLTSLDFWSFDVTHVTNMSEMFYGCNSLIDLNFNVSNFDTSNVTDMSSMFAYCNSLTSLDMRQFNTSNVTNMDDMFYYCQNLSNLDLSNFNTSKVFTMGYMFYGCLSLTNLNLSSFDTSHVIAKQQMLSFSNDNIFRVKYFSLTLGKNLDISGTSLTDVPNDSSYTGNWKNIGTGTMPHPTGSFIYNSTDLMTYYNGATMADTYVWQPKISNVANYTVNFDSNGGSSVSSESITDGATATKPSDPTKSGYIFGGWYTDSSCTTAYNFSSPVTGDMTLYAKWTLDNSTPPSSSVPDTGGSSSDSSNSDNSSSSSSSSSSNSSNSSNSSSSSDNSSNTTSTNQPSSTPNPASSTNTKANKLPSTGEQVGSFLTIAGILTVISAFVLGFANKRKEEK
ncbi:MAG: BspA family leucine-rich repeat surface protein [Streptococcaceae bacterium]|nr:BspA family leucine-rich repeat surface protein [Streptococcaceae bacterium]